MDKTIWISWERHRRNQSISRETGIRLFEIADAYHPMIRYPVLLFRTFMLTNRERPRKIVVQNPSVVLSLFTVVLGKMRKQRVIVDAHNIGVRFEHSNPTMRRIGQFLNHLVMKNAHLTIVTNSRLAEYVSAKKGRPFVLPDPFPVFGAYEKAELGNGKNVFFICTFSSDEPYVAVFEAAEYLEDDVRIHVSGNHGKKDVGKERLPDNIVLTGYLPDRDYVAYLHSADMIVDLTYREDCLVCGAYESVAAEKPLLLSDRSGLREYFGEGALYTDNTPRDIAAKIEEMLENLPVRIKKVRHLKNRRTRDWRDRKKALERLLESI